MRWICYGVAVVATVAACWLWLFVLSQSGGEGAVVPVASRVARGAVTPSPVKPVHHTWFRLQTACMGGEEWAYIPSVDHWVKGRAPDGGPIRCDVGDVRETLERDGAVTRSRPHAGG